MLYTKYFKKLTKTQKLLTAFVLLLASFILLTKGILLKPPNNTVNSTVLGIKHILKYVPGTCPKELNTFCDQNQGTCAKTLYVVDGDTIHVSINKQEYKVRYIGIDTPELSKEPYIAEQAKIYNAKLVGGKWICLVKDVRETDRYGRLLRYVYTTSSSNQTKQNSTQTSLQQTETNKPNNNKPPQTNNPNLPSGIPNLPPDLSNLPPNIIFVNLELIKNGWAKALTIPPDTKYSDLFILLQKQAQKEKLGIWKDE